MIGIKKWNKRTDIEYEMDFSPTGIDYDSWDKRTADKYFKWYMQQLPVRTEYLRKRVADDLQMELSRLDYSPQSLIPVWDWYILTAIIEQTPKKEIRKMRQSPFYALVGESAVNTEQMSLNSILIQRDIGMYLARVMLQESPALKWMFEHDAPSKKIKNVFNIRPVLTGFVGENHPYSFEPIHMVGVQGVSVLEGNAKKQDLYDLFIQYSKWLPGGRE